ncbi:MAG: hypothetical protein IPF41_13600 [Flavobacteriales bacterium]|nr:hypothetical protein [Flavobacteriales bacterium]
MISFFSRLSLPALLLVSLFTLRAPKASAQDSPSGVMEAIVTMRDPGVDVQAWQRFALRVGKETGANIEYSCQRAGIIVLRLERPSIQEKADAITLVRRLLTDAGITTAVEFLHVHVERTSVNKC